MFEGRNDYLEMSGADYEAMYARYIGRNLDQLILAAGPVEGKRVLDLCAGSGAVSRRVKELGAAHVTAADKSRKMLEGLFEKGVDQVVVLDQPDYQIALGSIVEQVGSEYDLVICRQAVNYWWSTNSLSDAMLPLKRGGFFVFNTFHGDGWVDPYHPTTSEYEIDGVHFAEAHWLVNNTIYHVQCCEGYPPHITTFDNIPRGVFKLTLDRQIGFIKGWTVERYGPTDIYVVERLPE